VIPAWMAAPRTFFVRAASGAEKADWIAKLTASIAEVRAPRAQCSDLLYAVHRSHRWKVHRNHRNGVPWHPLS
jgi:hypothetical protein